MPIRKVKGGFKWGKHGHVYKTRKGAERQAAAAYANGYEESHSRSIRNKIQELKFGSMDTLGPSDFGFQNEVRPASLDRDEVVKTMTDNCQQLMANRFNTPLNDVDLQKFERLVADWVSTINQPEIPES